MTLTAEALVDDVVATLTTGHRLVTPPDIVEWAEDRFYILETKRPIVLQPIQKVVLRLMSELLPSGFKWENLFYSTIKKSGKTTIAALYQRWAAETWGDWGEIYHMGNKQQQAKDRAFKLTKQSIMLAPRHEQNQWQLDTLKMTYENNSFIEAMPMSAAGSAGGNQRLTTWTELHGYKHGEHEMMWTEMQPVPTQRLSQRFVESYAGYEGESLLLKRIWELSEAGERLHDDYPIFGNYAAGMIAYIDTGVEARRMPWQRGDAGRRYYAKQAKTETPNEFARLHLNKWAETLSNFIDSSLWERLAYDDVTQLQITTGELGWEQITDVVIGVDASTSGDSTALSVLTYRAKDDTVVELLTLVWTPDSQGGVIDYEETIIPALENLLATYRVISVAYDPWQLHSEMTRLTKRYGQRFYPFDQGNERLEADTDLHKRIRVGTFRYHKDSPLTQAIKNANGKENEKGVRLVKKADSRKIDPIVAASMASWRLVELMSQPSGEVIYDDSIRVEIGW